MKGVIQKSVHGAEPAENTEPQQSSEAPEASDEGIEKVNLAAQQVMYGDQTHDGIVKMLTSGKDDPVNTLATVTTNIITQLDEKSGDQIPEDAILPAAGEVLSLVAELAEKTGAFAADENVQTQAMGTMFSMLGDHYGLSEEDMAELKQFVAEQQGATQGA